MKALPILAFIFLVITSSCQPSPDLHTPGITSALEKIPMGKPVQFTIKETFPLFCTDQDQFSITQIVENGSRTLKLEHSCIGIVGSGVDEYCENGKIIRKSLGECSDAISCVKDYSVNYVFSWDQQEYVVVTEKCKGLTIQRELKQQAPAGNYQVIVNNKVIKEFIIIQTDQKP
jgi:hypothetical protein